MHTQLTKEERDRISLIDALGLGAAAIGRTLHRDHSTIGRELKRNSTAGECLPISLLVRQEKSG